MKKRIIASMLLAAVLGTLSCGTENRAPETTTDIPESETVETTAYPNARDKSDLPASYDLGGFKLRVASNVPNEAVISDYIFAPAEENGDILNDVYYKRNRKICDTYNFEIELITMDNVNSSVRQAVLASDDAYDVALPYLHQAAPGSSDGAYLNLYSVPNLDLVKNYWSQNFNRDISIDGSQFFAIGDIMTSDDDNITITMFNSSLAKDYNIENLYDLVREGKWTYDVMMKYIKLVAEDLDADGRMTKSDRAGILYASNNCFAPYLASVGARLFDKDSSDMPVISDNTEKLYKICDIINDMLDTSRYAVEWTQYGGEQVSVITSMVDTKQVIFQNMVMSQIRRLYRDITVDFGLLPIPKLDESQEQYCSTVWKGFNVITIPSSTVNIDKTGFALEALAAGSDNITDTYYHKCLESKYTRDVESYEMIELAGENVIYDIGVIYDWGGLCTALTGAANNSSGNYASLYESYKEMAAADMQKFTKEINE